MFGAQKVVVLLKESMSKDVNTMAGKDGEA